MRGFPTVLLADDDENDRYLLDLAFEKNGLPNVLQVVRNGEEAIDYLRGDGVYSDREKYPWPSLMLLDLKMPLVDDFEALAWWQKQEKTPAFPIIVLSSSSQERDIQRAMALGATEYCAKPVDFQHVLVVARKLRDRWLSTERALC